MNNNEVIIIIQYLTLLELDIDKTITHQNIQSQFRKLSHIYHPDIANERYSDGKKFIELQQAKEYLISNIEYVNIMIRNGFRTNYDIKDELRKQREETARKEAERKAKEEAERKAAEEARKRAEEERIRKEEQRRKEEEERQRTLRELKEIENTLNNLLKSLDKDIYYDKEYNYIISLINDFISRLYNRRYYKEEYEILMKEISKVKTKKYYEKVKKIKKIAFYLASSITALIIFIVLSINLIIPSIKYNKALKNIENRDYLSAGEILNTIKYFKDADLQYSLLDVYKNLDNNNYEKAINIIKENSGNVYLNYNTDGGYLDGNLDDSSSLQLKESKKNGYAFSYYEVEKYEVNTEDELFLNVMLKAIYEIEQYDIEFILNDGILDNNDISTYDIETSDIELPIPYKNGYDFVGWYNSDGNQIDIIRKGSYGNICLIAKYEPKIYTINYNLNGGANNENNVFEYNIESNDIHIKNPIKDGYTFLGWYANGITELNKNYIITSGNTGNIELTAHWQANDYKIVYDLNGGTNNESNPSGYIMDSGNIIIYQANKLGYTFTGWTTPEDNRLRENFVINDGTYGNINLIANYVPNNYTISFDVNGGKELLNNKVIVEFDANYILSIPVRESYEFLGWTNENGEIFLNEYKHIVDSDIELVAKWKPIEYTIEYNLNGGVNHIENPSIYTTEKEVTLKYPTKTGYTFIGWTTYINSQPVKDYNVSINNYGNLKLTANYKANTYNIIYDVNAGDALLNNKQTVLYDSEFDTVVPTKTGYDFVGWYLNNEKFDLEKWDMLNNITLKAKWSPKRYLINIIDEVLNQFEVEYDSIFIINNQLKENYIFKGYYSEPYGKGKKYTDEFGKSLDIYKNVDGINLYPYYQYSVEFISNGGSEVSKLIYDENVFLDPDIMSVKENRTFEGWYTDINLTSKFVKVIGNVKVYAKWLEETDTSLFEYEFLDNLKITKYIGTLEEVIIPSHIGGIEVTELNELLFLDNKAKKIELSYGIEKIPYGMCMNCYNLENIIIPDSVKEIGSNSFEFCTNLKSLRFSDNVEIIGSGCLSNCTGLESLIIPFLGVGPDDYYSGNLEYLFGYKNRYNNLKEIILTKTIKLGKNAFNNCSNLKNVKLPDGLLSIGKYAFYNCINIENIVIPKSVTKLDDYSFFGCSKLKEIILPNVTIIGDSVFSNCINLKKLEILSDKVSFGMDLFSGCTLDTLKCPYPSYYVRSMSSNSFGGHFKEYIITGITPIFEQFPGTSTSFGLDILKKSDKVYVSDTINYLCSTELDNCINIKEINLPSLDIIYSNYNIDIDILTIRDGEKLNRELLSNFTHVKKLTLPNNLIQVDHETFNDCLNLQEIVANGDNFTSIDGILYTKDLKTIIRYPIGKQEIKYEINSLTENIENGCFKNCSLKELIISDNVSEIPEDALANFTSLSYLYIGQNVNNLNRSMFNGTYNIENLYISDENIKYDSRNDCNAIIETSINKIIFGTMNTVIPDTVEIIGESAFAHNENIYEILIPSSVKTIEQNAFYYCENLEKVYIENGLETIGHCAFGSCSFASIFLPNTIINIGGYAFYGVTIDRYLTIYCESSGPLETWDKDWNCGSKPDEIEFRIYFITYYNQQRQ